MNRRFFDRVFTPVYAGILLAASGLVHGADVSSYAIRKGLHYEQTSAAAPTPVPSVAANFTAEVLGDASAITGVSLTIPSAFFPSAELSPNDSGTGYDFTLPQDSMQNLDFLVPNGQYMFLITSDNDGDSFAPLNLSSSTVPGAIPYLTDYAGAQSIDASANYTLNFNEQTGATGNDHFELRIFEDGVEIFSDSGTGTSVVIPAGTLTANTTYDATLRFVRELQRDTSTYPGATGTAEVYTQTKFTLDTGEGGGGTDTTPPQWLLTLPANGATNVPVNSSVTFTFNEPMANTHAVEWSANVNTAALTYTWVNGGVSLTATSRGAFPPNSTVTWRLNPTAAGATNFRDLAGNQLATATYQGSFTTGEAGSVDPCDPNGQDTGLGFGNFYKTVEYVQTNNAAPVLDNDMPANFGASYRGATNQNVTAVSVSGPAGNFPLTNLFGFFFASSEFATPAQLETAYPAGNYTINATGAGTATLAVGSTAQLPVPQILNLTALTNMNVVQPFTLNFVPFTGAGANDSIFISISEANGTNEFHAPDPCRNIELPNTATSIVIPANTFKAGQKYRGSISFSRNSFDTNQIPNTGLSAGVSLTTSFDFSGGGGTTTAPNWSSFTRNPDGTVTYTITGDTGANVTIEASENITAGWTTLTNVVLTTGSQQITIDPRNPVRRFYRARVQ
jgi:hypothetical protein